VITAKAATIITSKPAHGRTHLAIGSVFTSVFISVETLCRPSLQQGEVTIHGNGDRSGPGVFPRTPDGHRSLSAQLGKKFSLF